MPARAMRRLPDAPRVRSGPSAAASVASVHQLYATSHDAYLEAELLRYHDPLALQLARRMSHRGEMIEDLSQVPRIALLQAVRNYDPDRGAQFTSYAVPAILGALKRHLRDRGWLVRPPCRLQAAYLSVSTALEDLGGGRDPTVTELAEHSRLAEHVVVETFSARAGRRATPLDAWLLRPDDAPWHESVSDHGAALATVDDRLLVAQLVGLLRSLSGTS